MMPWGKLCASQFIFLFVCLFKSRGIIVVHFQDEGSSSCCVRTTFHDSFVNFFKSMFLIFQLCDSQSFVTTRQSCSSQPTVQNDAQIFHYKPQRCKYYFMSAQNYVSGTFSKLFLDRTFPKIVLDDPIHVSSHFNFMLQTTEYLISSYKYGSFVKVINFLESFNIFDKTISNLSGLE